MVQAAVCCRSEAVLSLLTIALIATGYRKDFPQLVAIRSAMNPSVSTSSSAECSAQPLVFTARATFLADDLQFAGYTIRRLVRFGSRRR
jgi:hypothetical protein